LKTLIDVSVPVLTFTLLAAVGLDLTTKEFARLRHQPLLVLVGLVGPLVLLPPIAIAIAFVFRPSSDVVASLLLIAACPIGGISNTYSYLGRASTALSVTLTGLSCLLAGVTMPLLGRGLALVIAQPLNMEVPLGLLFSQLLLMLSTPVAIGMLVRHYWADVAVRYRSSVQRLAFIGVGLMLLLIILDDPQAFFTGLRSTVPISAAFIVCCAAVGWMTAAMVTDDARDRFTIAAEFGTRNLGVAMAVAVTLLGRIEFARFAYTYFLTEIPLMLVAIALFKRRQFELVREPS
jgi:BASS family bile acid:Na+ symporter